MRRRATATLIPAVLTLVFMSSARAGCATADDPLATDRPTIANSSAVVPQGSLQVENGVSVARDQAVTTYDLPESRWRLGIAACTEFLVDLPDFTHALAQGGVNGATNIGGAVKHQFQDLPERLTLAATVGIYLNSGDKAIAGPGPASYLQAPWSFDLGDGWSANGMISETFHPRGPNDNSATQTSVYLDRSLAEQFDLFLQFANDLQRGAATLNRAGIGAAYRLAPTQQVDLAIGSGLNRASPKLFVTLGYSARFDRLFTDK